MKTDTTETENLNLGDNKIIKFIKNNLITLILFFVIVVVFLTHNHDLDYSNNRHDYDYANSRHSHSYANERHDHDYALQKLMLKSTTWPKRHKRNTKLLRELLFRNIKCFIINASSGVRPITIRVIKPAICYVQIKKF